MLVYLIFTIFLTVLDLFVYAKVYYWSSIGRAAGVLLITTKLAMIDLIFNSCFSLN